MTSFDWNYYSCLLQKKPFGGFTAIFLLQTNNNDDDGGDEGEKKKLWLCLKYTELYGWNMMSTDEMRAWLLHKMQDNDRM